MIAPRVLVGALATVALVGCTPNADTPSTGSALASERATPAQLVAARQGAMRMAVFTLANAGQAAKAEDTPVSRAAFPAGGLARFADTLPIYFPAATAGMPDSGALPAVWEEPEGFAAQAAQFRLATAELAEAAAADDRPGFVAALESTKAACKACHDSYRAED